VKRIIGIDIGGTKCAITIADVSKTSAINLLEKIAFPTETDKGFKHTQETLFATVEVFLKKYNKETIEAIGISCGGPLDSNKGIIGSPPNLPGWDDIPITQMLYETFGIPAFLQNDANACALVEWQMGAGRGCANMVFLTHGTGMGAGIIAGGMLIEGATGLGGEVGHIRLATDGPEGYGKKGSFEGFCSGGGIKRLAISMTETWVSEGYTPAWIKDGYNPKDITAKLLAEYANKGDAQALEIYKKSGEKLGEALAIIVDLLNPERIVIGSIFAHSGHLMKDSMEQALKREALSHSLSALQISPAETNEFIGDYAAIAVACYKIGLPLLPPLPETDNDVLSLYENLFERNPHLKTVRASLMEAYILIRDVYQNGNKLLICGNGGSAADSGHIVGELMKGFLKKRELEPETRQNLTRLYNALDNKQSSAWAGLLQGALPAIDLTQHNALSTAFANDNSPTLVFAQQIYGFGTKGDALLAISTSGNAENCCIAALTAKAMGINVISLTGMDGGTLATIADCAIKTPGNSTYEIQEHHVQVYHALCAMLEEKFF